MDTTRATQVEIMPSTDPRIDLYIKKSAGFAKPVLTRIRAIVHTACPVVAETIKWGFPHFEYKESILCSMAAFKQHCTFGFWQGAQMSDRFKLLAPVGERTAMGHFGQLKSVEDLPDDKILLDYLAEAMALIDSGAKLPRKKKPSLSQELEIPSDFAEALQSNGQIAAIFNNFSPSKKREYLEWFAEAKTDATRSKRVLIALDWIAEGKTRNWKYESKRPH